MCRFVLAEVYSGNAFVTTCFEGGWQAGVDRYCPVNFLFVLLSKALDS